MRGSRFILFFGGLLGSASGGSLLTAPTLSWTSGTTDNTPDLSVTFPDILVTGTDVTFEYATNSGFSGATSVLHDLTSPEALAQAMTLALSTLADGTWYIRVKYEGSAWSNTETKTISTVALALDGQGTTNSSASPFTVALTTSNGSGLITVCAGSNNTNALVPTAAGLTFTQRGSTVTNGGDTNSIWTAPYSSNFSGNITLTQTGAPAFSTVTAFGVSGVRTASPFDGSPVTGTSSPVSITTTVADTFIFATYGSNQASPGAGAGWTAINSSNFWITEYKIVSSIQTGLTATVGAGFTLAGIINAIAKGP